MRHARSRCINHVIEADRRKQVETIVQSLCVLVVDDNQYMRKMIRNLLVNCGIKDIYEAADGIAALDIDPHHGARRR